MKWSLKLTVMDGHHEQKKTLSGWRLHRLLQKYCSGMLVKMNKIAGAVIPSAFLKYNYIIAGKGYSRK